MALQQLIKKINGNYEPTGLYSFEFVSNTGDTISEIFFTLPPTDQSITESRRTGLKPTLYGSDIADFGNEAKEIKISGELYFYYVGDSQNPLARDISDPTYAIDGYSEYLKLRFMLMRYRDYMMTSKSKLNAPNFSGKGFLGVNELKKFVKDKLSSGQGALIDQVELIYHDYDLDNHFYMLIESFSARQSANDVFSIFYDISGKGYKVDDRSSKKLTAPDVKLSIPETIDQVTQELSAFNLTEDINNMQINISGEDGLFELNAQLQEYIDSIITSREKILAGSSPYVAIATGVEGEMLYNSIYKSCNDIINNIEETIPDNLKYDFEQGNVAIDDVLDTETLKYYNSIQKIFIHNYAVKAAMESNPQPRQLSYQADIDDYVLDSDQFEQDNNSFTVDVYEPYLFHTIKTNESLKSIALKYYNDASIWIKIAQANEITENDIIDNDLTGEVIKIPVTSGSINMSNINLVYEAVLNRHKPEIFFHGSDILTIDKKMLLTINGNRKLISGIECTIQNISARLREKKGSLNPYHPDWGILSFDENTPYLVQLDRVLTDMVSQALDDPRTSLAEIDYDKLIIQQDMFKTKLKISLLGGYNTETGVTHE